MAMSNFILGIEDLKIQEAQQFSKTILIFKVVQE